MDTNDTSQQSNEEGANKGGHERIKDFNRKERERRRLISEKMAVKRKLKEEQMQRELEKILPKKVQKGG